MAKVINDRILIKPIDTPEQKTESGVIIPGTQRYQTCSYAEVIDASAGYYENGTFVPMEVKKGDEIIYVKGAIHEIKVEGKIVQSITQSEVVCITKHAAAEIPAE